MFHSLDLPNIVWAYATISIVYHSQYKQPLSPTLTAELFDAIAKAALLLLTKFYNQNVQIYAFLAGSGILGVHVFVTEIV